MLVTFILVSSVCTYLAAMWMHRVCVCVLCGAEMASIVRRQSRHRRHTDTQHIIHADFPLGLFIVRVHKQRRNGIRTTTKGKNSEKLHVANRIWIEENGKVATDFVEWLTKQKCWSAKESRAAAARQFTDPWMLCSQHNTYESHLRLAQHSPALCPHSCLAQFS